MTSTIERAIERLEPDFDQAKYSAMSIEDRKLYLSVLSNEVKRKNKRFFESMNGIVEWNNGKGE